MRAVILASVIFAVVIALAMLGLMPTRLQVHDAVPARVETRSSKSVRVQVNNTPAAKAEKVEPGSVRKAGRESSNHKIKVVGEPYVSPADAELDALVRAQIELEKYLRTLNPPVYWKPPLEYIRHSLVKDMPDPVAVPLKDPENQDFISQQSGANGLKRYELAFDITPAARREMLYLARQDRSKDRLLLLLPVLGGAVLLLLAGAAYINLDERSKGYYTTWLRLAAGSAIIAAVGVGWWWFRHGAVE